MQMYICIKAYKKYDLLIINFEANTRLFNIRMC